MACVLWLDDRIDQRRAEIDALSRLGHEVHSAASESEAVRLLQSGFLPDVVIQDLHRRPSDAQIASLRRRTKATGAHVSGWTFYRDVLRPGFPYIPVIIYTADAFDGANQELAAEFNLTLVPKGHSSSQALLAAVQTALNAQRLVLLAPASSPALVSVDFNRVNTALIRHLAQNPSDLHAVSWAAFENLIATLLREMGYEVWHTPLTRDGGVDIWALHRSDLGDVLYAIDAKKYAPTKVLGPEPIRAIYGVAEAERANVGMIVTTGTFGPAAKAFADQLRYRVSLREYEDIVRWIETVQGSTQPNKDLQPSATGVIMSRRG